MADQIGRLRRRPVAAARPGDAPDHRPTASHDQPASPPSLARLAADPFDHADELDRSTTRVVIKGGKQEQMEMWMLNDLMSHL